MVEIKISIISEGLCSKCWLVLLCFMFFFLGFYTLGSAFGYEGSLFYTKWWLSLSLCFMIFDSIYFSPAMISLDYSTLYLDVYLAKKQTVLKLLIVSLLLSESSWTIPTMVWSQSDSNAFSSEVVRLSNWERSVSYNGSFESFDLILYLKLVTNRNPESN